MLQSSFLEIQHNAPHQFRTRNDLVEAQRIRTAGIEKEGKSTKSAIILPLITVWLQVRVLPGPHHIGCPSTPKSVHLRPVK